MYCLAPLSAADGGAAEVVLGDHLVERRDLGLAAPLLPRRLREQRRLAQLDDLVGLVRFRRGIRTRLDGFAALAGRPVVLLDRVPALGRSIGVTEDLGVRSRFHVHLGEICGIADFSVQ